MAKNKDYLIFVVTNQSGIGRGFYDERAVQSLHDQMNADLAKIDAHIDGLEFCPHHPKEAQPEYLTTCDCRKPAPGMLLRLIAKWQIDPAQSLMIGDKDTDVAAATANATRFRLTSCSKMTSPTPTPKNPVRKEPIPVKKLPTIPWRGFGNL